MWKNILIGLAVAVFFSILYVLTVFDRLGEQIYDLFLHFRADRDRSDVVVFLDVDDNAIAYNGVFPWPRSIPAEGLLRLKEYGASALIFDIEYIDQGPQGIDSLYLNQGLGNDFNRSFSEINAAAQDIFAALGAGRIRQNDIDFYANSLSSLITSEQRNLFTKAQGVARDNDKYLAQAIALFGHSWSSLNLREHPLDGEQAERRPAIAEKRFPYPVNAADDAHRGAGFVDVLPALPVFANAAKGAGFTNVEIDDDGVRRRVYLAQNVQDHWYLQLSFSPLVHYLGRPEIELNRKKLTLKQAQLLDGRVKDIVIPLDHKGRMMLDWPKTDYNDSYSHISFAQFSLLDDIEMELDYYSRALVSADIPFFAQFDPSLSRVSAVLLDAGEYFDAAHEAKNLAMEHISDEYFDDYIRYRNQAFSLLGEVLSMDIDIKTLELAALLGAEYPESADVIEDEADYIAQLAGILAVNLERRNELSAANAKLLRDKFCILGRVDTGTTDYGANPFYGKYINVGTHGVVLDMILSESFIIPISLPWRILFALVCVFLFFLISARLSPVPRAASGFLVTVFVIAVVALLFRFTGVFMNPLLVTFSMIVAVILREIIYYAGSEREKKFIRQAFSTYVSHDVVNEIIADPSRLQLGGTKRYMTAIFTDVKGFSTISEQLNPEQLVSLLNRYLSAMSDAILAEKGTIDKYVGDAIVAFFGAPLDLPDHALRACVSAISMKHIEDELNKVVMAENLSPMPLFTRFGINTGDMVAGNMGTGNKMNYTIMGNTVNLAARLEGVNKSYGTRILASNDTIKGTNGLVLTRRLDRVRVVGINEPVRLHELINTVEKATPEEQKLVEVFHQALDYFENRDWKRAAEGFEESLAMEGKDPSSKYLERCKDFLVKPPEDTWDGVYNMTEK
ncbi:MAG: CHASE2 domain-containing protein [Treponema sp.]|nr:CHASE2 domain-containing protein [Treponema sp.]